MACLVSDMSRMGRCPCSGVSSICTTRHSLDQHPTPRSSTRDLTDQFACMSPSALLVGLWNGLIASIRTIDVVVTEAVTVALVRIMIDKDVVCISRTSEQMHLCKRYKHMA